jgi:hypothetical chaperone protein
MRNPSWKAWSAPRVSGEFQYEPIAAALDYEQQVSREELALVVDLGGGTSDFSIIRVSPEGARRADRQQDILAAAGVHVGGTDFDPLPSAPYVELATWHRINRLYDPAVLRELRHTQREARDPARVAAIISIVTHREGHRLAGAVEDAKIALTDADETVLNFQGEDVALSPRITRHELGAAIAGRIAKIEETIQMTLAIADLGAERIETVILTGGSTQIPAIMHTLHRLLPAARFVQTDAFGSVGLGLALEARRRFA